MPMTPEERREKDRLRQQKRRREQPEHMRAINRKSRQNNREKAIARDREYYEAHAEEKRAYALAYRAAHLEERHAYEAGYREVHREKMRLYQELYRPEHTEERREYEKAYKRAFPEKIRAKRRRRRAKQAGAPRNDLTHAQWLEIQSAQDHRCYYCGKRCKGKLTQDHIIPLSKGGAHTLHNVIGACRSCNSKKNAGPPLTPVQPMLLTIAPKKKQTS
jgi:5-methylcytosine-specific restriction endonuclease McrA